MQHAGLQYGQGAANSLHEPPFAHADIPQGNGGNSTSSLRQFRKKDGNEKNSTTDLNTSIENSHIARVPPHNHYPARPNDYYRYQQPYPDYNSPFKETPAQVKYSEIAETPPQPLQHVDHLPSALQKHKEVHKEFIDMCNISQQTHMKQTYPDNLSRQQSYPPDAASVHHQYLHKEPQVHPGYKPESQYQQYPQIPKYNMPSQCRKYPPPPPENDFLAKLQRINPSMARSIMSDHHIRESQATYPTMDQNRMYPQNQRYYSNNLSYNYQPYNYPSSCNYKHPEYSRSNQMAVGGAQYPALNPHSDRSLSPRNLHMMNYANSQKISPNYSQYQPEYAQHYQHRREYYQQQCRTNPYMGGHQISPESNDRGGSGGLRHYLENWAEEEATAEITPIFKENIRIHNNEASNEQVIVINSSDIPQCLENVSLVPTENGQYIIKTGVDNSLVKIKETPENNGEVNVQIVETPPKSDCMLEESQKISEETTTTVPYQEKQNQKDCNETQTGQPVEEQKRTEEKNEEKVEESAETSVIVANELSLIKDMPLIEEEHARNQESEDPVEKPTEILEEPSKKEENVIDNHNETTEENRVVTTRRTQRIFSVDDIINNIGSSPTQTRRNSLQFVPKGTDEATSEESATNDKEVSENANEETEYRNAISIEDDNVILEIGGAWVQLNLNHHNGTKVLSVLPLSESLVIDVNANYQGSKESEENLQSAQCEETQPKDNKVEDAGENVHNVEENLGNVEEILQNIEENLQSIDDSSQNVEECRQNVEESLQNVEESLQNVEESLQNVEESFENIEENLLNIEANVQNVEEIVLPAQENLEDGLSAEKVQLENTSDVSLEENLQTDEHLDNISADVCQSEVVIGEENIDEMILELHDEAIIKEISLQGEEEEEEVQVKKPKIIESSKRRDEKRKSRDGDERRKSSSKKIKYEERRDSEERYKVKKAQRVEDIDRVIKKNRNESDRRKEIEDAKKKESVSKKHDRKISFSEEVSKKEDEGKSKKQENKLISQSSIEEEVLKKEDDSKKRELKEDMLKIKKSERKSQEEETKKKEVTGDVPKVKKQEKKLSPQNSIEDEELKKKELQEEVPTWRKTEKKLVSQIEEVQQKEATDSKKQEKKSATSGDLREKKREKRSVSHSSLDEEDEKKKASPQVGALSEKSEECKKDDEVVESKEVNQDTSSHGTDVVQAVEEMITLKQMEEINKESEKVVTKAAKKLYIEPLVKPKNEESRKNKKSIKIEETVNKIKSLKEKSAREDEWKKTEKKCPKVTKKVTFNLETDVRESSKEEIDRKKLSWKEYYSRKRKSSPVRIPEETKNKIMEDTVTSSDDINEEVVEKVELSRESVIIKDTVKKSPPRRPPTNWEDDTPSPSSPTKDEVMSTTNPNRKCIIDVNEFNIKPIESVSTPSPVSSSQFSYHSEDDSLQVYKDVVDSKLNSLNIRIPKLSKPKPVDRLSVLLDRFLNKVSLNCEELEEVKKFIEIKRKMQKPTYEVRGERDYKDLKLHFRKVPEKRKKKRFRNLYAEDSSEDSDSSRSDKGVGDYSVYQRDSQGVPKLIIKRNSGLPQPFVKLERSQAVELLAKKRKFY